MFREENEQCARGYYIFREVDEQYFTVCDAGEMF